MTSKFQNQIQTRRFQVKHPIFIGRVCQVLMSQELGYDVKKMHSLNDY